MAPHAKAGPHPKLLRKRLLDVCRRARAGGVEFIELQTNAVLIDADYARAMADAGVTYAIGRTGGAFAAANERNLPYEAGTAVAHGLSREEALKAITLYPARILGVADQLGALSPGLLASFIVTDGDPLQTATQIERLFVQGREVSAANRQTRLADRYRERPVSR
jgi:imidazolonepropionase-like amidohydrolase